MLDVSRLRGFVRRALIERWTRPATLVDAVSRLVAQNDLVREALVRAERMPLTPAGAGALDPAILEAMARDRLFRRLLRSARITGIGMERLLTAARAALLHNAITTKEEPAPDLLAFQCALAEQCFINSYVFDAPESELERVEALKAAFGAALQSGEPLPPQWVAAIASYSPLHALPGAADLLQRPWPEPVAELTDCQIRQPLEERRLADTMPALTPIEDGVSRAVRAQYEESPYPVWVAVSKPEKSVGIDADLKVRFPRATIRPRENTDRTDILIAGCGTGQQAAEIALQYSGASVLAVDLSLASLSYAKRQTELLALDNIEYAQADILGLGALDRTFDLIVATGVLHHMADPEAGLRALLTRLRPGGYVMLGFYSELARQHVVAVQRYAAEHGYRPTLGDIRRFRQEIMALDNTSPLKAIAAVPDFYSTSECRDLLFHVQEHRMTLPRIKAMLAAHDLEFLGFEIDPQTRRRYRLAHPGDRTMANLDGWDAFERQHPRTFVGMYQFWAQKRA